MPGAEAAYAFRKPLVVRGLRIVGGGHADFPVLVSVVDPNLRSTAFGGNVRSASGFDIEFRAADQVTILDHEIERYTPSTGALVAWVRLPSITGDTNYTLNLYYGDPSVTCARNNPGRVWNPGYRYVYHLAESGAANPVDSTSNAVPAARNPTADPGIANAYTAAGWIGGGLDLQSGPVVPPAGQFQLTTPTHVRVTDGALAASPAFTLEVWFRVETKAVGAFYGLQTKGRESNANWIGGYLTPLGAIHRFGLGWFAPPGNVDAAPNLSTARWYHGVVTSTGGANPTRTVYLDGAVIAASGVAAPLAAVAQPTRLGDDSNGNYLDGQIDEARSSNVARSAAWIQTTFQNHRCPSLSVLPAGCAGGDAFVDDSGAQVAAALPAFVNNTAASGLGLTGTKDGGLSWADWNGDLCPDVAVNTSSATLRTRLYLQARGSACAGAFTDVTSCLASGMLANTTERSLVWGDVNGDGRLDLARNTSGRIEVYLNNGPGTTSGAGCPAAGVPWSRFGNPATGNPSQVIDAALVPGLNSEGLGFLDYDQDGDLDLVADNGANGILMLGNNGLGGLAPAAGTGLPTSTPPNGDYGAVADVDGDGDVAILMRKDNAVDLWTSGGAVYFPSGLDLAASDANKGGAAFCDLDNDGDLDLVWTDAPSTGVYERQSGGSYVLRPTGALFTGSDFDGVTCGDLDNDGDVDIVASAGVSGSPGASGATDRILRNDGGFAFTNVTPAAFGGGDGEAVTVADYDRDGDLDVLINQWDSTGAAPNQLWRNERNDRNYLVVRALLDPDGAGPLAQRDAIGATVTLRSCAGSLRAGMREINGGEGHGSQGSLLAHFGLPGTGSPSGPNQIYVVRVQYVGGVVRERAVLPGALGCYQQVTISNLDANDTAACAATAVELQSFTAEACDGGVDLRWSTASEISNLGFHVNRAPAPGGPFERITPGLIPGLGSSPTGEHYAFRDAPRPNGTPAFYTLEDVDTSGQTTVHGPVAATPREGAVCGADPGDDAGSKGSRPGTVRYGGPGRPELREIERGPTHVVLELLTPGFDTIQEGQGVRVLLPGFEEPLGRGLLAVPFRRALVPVLAGRGVRIASVTRREPVVFEGLRLVGAAAAELEVGASGVVRPRRARGSRSLSAFLDLAPAIGARLVGTAFQGEAKKAEVNLHPFRFDGRGRRLTLYRRLVVRLDFVGRERAERGLGGKRGRRVPKGMGGAVPGLAAQLVTGAEGLYEVAFEEAFAAGTRPVPLSSLRLSRRGQSVPYRVEPKASSFGPGGRLLFLGGGSGNPWGEAVYELQVGVGGPVMAEIDASPSGSPVTEIYSERTFEETRYFQAALLDAPDPWLWDLVVSPARKTIPFTLSPVAPSSWRQGRVEVRLQGASDFDSETDHHVRVLVNGVPLGEASWAGRAAHTIAGVLPAGVLREGANDLTLENVADTGAAYSMVFLDRFTVRWPRALVASGGEALGEADEGGAVVLAGVSGQTFVFDTTAAPAWVRGAVLDPAGIRFRVERGRRYGVFDRTGVRRPVVRRPGGSTLRAASNGADWLLVGPRELLGAASPLLELRRGQGLRTRAVALEDVYEQFSHGEKDPGAIRLFLAHAYASWTPPSPRYVLLLGDSSYDPKDLLKSGFRDLVPSLPLRTSYLWTVSDPALGAVNGDDLVPDVAVGRLPAKNVEEARRLVDKILAFERGGYDLSGPAVLVADNADAGGDFEADAETLAGGVLAARPVERVYLRELGGATRDTVRAAFDAGPALVSYLGHGGTAVWASENVWNNLDVPTLAPQARPPFLLTMNCLNGFFQFPMLDALGEAFVKGEGRGAIAAFSPSGLSLNAAAHVYHEAILREVDSRGHHRLGDAILSAQEAYADSGALPELLGIYHLFGDPALRIWP